jgi:hypothetical protein
MGVRSRELMASEADESRASISLLGAAAKGLPDFHKQVILALNLS